MPNPDANITRKEILTTVTELNNLEVVQNGLGNRRPEDCSAIGAYAPTWQSLGYHFLGAYPDGSIFAYHPTRFTNIATVFFNMEPGKKALDPGILNNVFEDLLGLRASQERTITVVAVHGESSNTDLTNIQNGVRALGAIARLNFGPAQSNTFWTCTESPKVFTNTLPMGGAMNLMQTNNPEIIHTIIMDYKREVSSIHSPERLRKFLGNHPLLRDGQTRVSFRGVKNYESQ